MKVHILVCDWFEGLLPDFVPSFPSLFMEMFDAVQEGLTYQLYNVPEGEFPSSLNRSDLYLIAGSRAGAYEPLPWIEQAIRFVQRAAEANIRLTGTCFGHQLIAQALGGKVEPAPQGWGAGARCSTVIHPAATSYLPDGLLCLLYNHNDQVVHLPPAAERIATSEFCPNEALRIGPRILTFQGHPEYNLPYMRHVIDIASHVEEEVKEAARNSLGIPVLHHLEVARWMINL
ncbi:MAG: hypothetical protein LIP08_05620 [Bacteroides sp.]|nr:hypothetical protein [Bacteroides sp.]